MNKPSKLHFLQTMYEEVGQMLKAAARSASKESAMTISKLNVAYGGLRPAEPSARSDAWLVKSISRLESIRYELVTLAENRLYTR